MEGNHRQSSAGIQAFHRVRHYLFHRTKLIVYRDADGLETAFGRMLLFPQGRCRHGAANHIHQFQSCFNRCRLSAAADSGSDLRCIALLAVIVENTLQFFIGPGIDHCVGVEGIAAVHAHVQRGIRHIGEATGTVIQLRGGYAQIQQNAVHPGKLQILQYLLHLAEIGMHQGHPVLIGCQPFSRSLQRHRVPVDADESAGGKPGRDLAGMACAAQGTVHINAVRLNMQSIQALAQQDGNMEKLTHRPIASRDASNFSGVRFSRSKAANSSASQISA